MLTAVKKIQEWGNSLGIRLSKDELERQSIHAHDEVEIFLKKKASPARELFGSLQIKEPTDKIMRKIDRAFKSRYD